MTFSDILTLITLVASVATMVMVVLLFRMDRKTHAERRATAKTEQRQLGPGSCPAGGLHEWEYLGTNSWHLSEFRCNKCNVHENRVLTTDERALYDWEKRRQDA